MGFCTTFSLFSGFMIRNPDLRSFATAVDNFWKKQRNETPIQEAPVGEVTQEEMEELLEAVDNWLGMSDKHFKKHFKAYSNWEDHGENVEPAIVLCYSKGESEVDRWSKNFGGQYEVVEELWTDEEFLREAKEAFKQLGEDPIMKEAQIVPKMEWIQGLTVG